MLPFSAHCNGADFPKPREQEGRGQAKSGKTISPFKGPILYLFYFFILDFSRVDSDI